MDGILVVKVLEYDTADGDPTICQVEITAGASVSTRTVNVRHGMGSLVADTEAKSTQDVSRLARAQEMVDVQVAEDGK